MDPVTHTLAGAALGRTGLARTTPMAMPALLVGANVPDVDVLASFGGADFSLAFRRGWSHGPLGLLILPIVLVAILSVWRRLRGGPDDPPVRHGRLTLIAYGAALTHPALDWLNTYGMRFLMPFSDTWYYGDALFIVDPWLWLMLACPVMLSSPSTERGVRLWSFAGIASSAVILLAPFVPIPAKVFWVLGIGGLIALRMRRAGGGEVSRTARVAVGVAVGYVAFMLAGTAIARRQVARTDDIALGSVLMAGPVPANPFHRQIVVGLGDAYRLRTINWILGGRPVTPAVTVPIGDGPPARAAAAAPGVKGFGQWARFPTFRVGDTNDGYHVDIVDVRYSELQGGFGTATVFLTDGLVPVRANVN